MLFLGSPESRSFLPNAELHLWADFALELPVERVKTSSDEHRDLRLCLPSPAHSLLFLPLVSDPHCGPTALPSQSASSSQRPSNEASIDPHLPVFVPLFDPFVNVGWTQRLTLSKRKSLKVMESHF